MTNLFYFLGALFGIAAYGISAYESHKETDTEYKKIFQLNAFISLIFILISIIFVTINSETTIFILKLLFNLTTGNTINLEENHDIFLQPIFIVSLVLFTMFWTLSSAKIHIRNISLKGLKKRSLAIQLFICKLKLSTEPNNHPKSIDELYKETIGYLTKPEKILNEIDIPVSEIFGKELLSPARLLNENIVPSPEEFHTYLLRMAKDGNFILLTHSTKAGALEEISPLSLRITSYKNKEIYVKLNSQGNLNHNHRKNA